MYKYLFLFALFSLSWAVPPQMFFQGNLLDEVGVAYSGDHSVTFNIYSEESGGTLLWSETQDVRFYNGLFIALLGSVVDIPSDIFDGSISYIQMVIDGDVLDYPTPFLTVPYSFRSAIADSADWAFGVHWDSLVGVPSTIYGIQRIRADGFPYIEDSLIVAAGDGIHIEQAGNTITLSSAHEDSWIVVGDDLYPRPTGNVGIGTASPERKLDVVGEGRFTGTLEIGEYMLPNIDGDEGQALVTDGSGVVEWQSVIGDDWGDQVAFTEAPIIGDGDSEPISLNYGRGLVVDGAELVVEAGEGLDFDGNTLINTGVLFDTELRGDVLGTVLANYLGRGVVDFENLNSVNIPTPGQFLVFHEDGGFEWVDGGDGTGSWIVSDIHQYSGVPGNVGIGIEEPAHKLDVVGSGRFTEELTIGEYTLPANIGLEGQILKNVGGTVQWANDNVSEEGEFGNDMVKAHSMDPVEGYLSAKVDNATIEVDYLNHVIRVKYDGITTDHIRNGTIRVEDLDSAEFALWDRDYTDDLTITTLFDGEVYGLYDNLLIRDEVIESRHLIAINEPSDGQVPAYNEETGGFVWADGGISHIDSNWIVVADTMYSGNEGNVGIGISSPQHKLDVEGDGRFAGPLTIGEYTLPAEDGRDGQVLKKLEGTIRWADDEVSEGGSGDNDKVKAHAADPEEGYLSRKIDDVTIGVDYEEHYIKVKHQGITTEHIRDGTIRVADLDSAEFALWDRDYTDDLTIETLFSGEVEGYYDDLRIVHGVINEDHFSSINVPEAGQVLSYSSPGNLEWITGTSSPADESWLGGGSGQMYNRYPADNVGIGTETPDERLHVNGNIKAVQGIILGEAVIDNITDSMLVLSPDGRLGWTSKAALSIGSGDGNWTFRITDGADTTLQTIGRWGIARAGNVLHGNADSTHINLGIESQSGQSGENNKYVTVSGGYDNTAMGDGASIGGGTENATSGIASRVGGGYNNTANAAYATISGGASNNITRSGASISGGTMNSAHGSFSTVGGGTANTSSADISTVAGGSNNLASGYGSAILGGGQNTATGSYSSIGGGFWNQASAVGANVSGGTTNHATAQYATVGGGLSNHAIGELSVIPGGSHLAVGNRSFGFRGGLAGAPSEVLNLASHSATFHIVDAHFHYNITNAPANFRLDGSSDFAFYLDAVSNSIGIGTETPSAKLDIEGTVGISDTLDMRQNQIVNMVLENRTDNPSAPAVGQIWMRIDY